MVGVPFYFALLFTSFHLGMSDATSMCNDTTYAKGSIFESNLNRVLEDLIHKTYETGFHTYYYGQSPNKIYGLLQCRGNASHEECDKCSLDAKTSVENICLKAIGGRVWLDTCFLRYENYNFFSHLDTQGHYRCEIPNSPIPDAFKSVTRNLLSKLLVNASKPENKGFATGKEVYSRNESPKSNTSTSVSFIVYGLVQCWRDISAQDCGLCLEKGRSILYESCSQRQEAQSMLGSCTVRYGREPFNSVSSPIGSPKISPSSGQNPPVQKTSKNPSNRLPIIFGLAGCLFLALFMICLFAMRSKIKSTRFAHDQDVSNSLIDQQQMVFSLKTLTVATDNFNKDNKLGEGGFGPVYKGRFSDGTEVAVKMLSVRSVQGKREFMNEVKLVAKIQHRNLVKLLGCCSEGPEKLLVYEYLPNKSLDTFLFDPERRKLLDWEKRYNIIIGIVRGLLYLHQDSQLRIIHRDIKASNILLDEILNPKIADFGLAKNFPEGESHVSTRIAGTYGYMAPEYAMQGQLSVKSDVYSFGVLLLEIVSGRKNTDFDLLPEMQVLLGWAWRLYNEGRIEDVIDQTLMATRFDQEKALRCLQIGLLCAQADAAIRPQMRDVIWMLNNCERLADPKKPAYLKYVNQNQNSTCSSGHQKLQRVDGLSHTNLRSSGFLPHCNLVTSKNDMSISELQPR
eukprot:Gb_35037 [translate_table: standard]